MIHVATILALELFQIATADEYPVASLGALRRGEELSVARDCLARRGFCWLNLDEEIALCRRQRSQRPRRSLQAQARAQDRGVSSEAT